MRARIEVIPRWKGKWIWNVYLCIPKESQYPEFLLEEVMKKYGFEAGKLDYYKVIAYQQLPPKEQLQEILSEILSEIEREIQSLLREIQEKGFAQ